MLILWAGLFQTEMIWRLSCREFGGAFADCFSLVFYLVVFMLCLAQMVGFSWC
jgi:hypothetical protein